MIDFFSDTVTRPTAGMRAAIAEAVVGDEQLDEDPTTTALETEAAGLLGTETALFLTSATMANAIAIQLHCGPGDELLAAESGHVLCYETATCAVHARAQGRGIPTPNGIFSGQDVRARIRPAMDHCPRVRLVVVENTANQAGGFPWLRSEVEDVLDTARDLGLAAHLDGARLLNAACHAGVPASALAQGFDTVTLCFSKGLGAPMGAVLGMPLAQRARARRLKHMMAGAMRQSGVLAAACRYALQHHVDRLADDQAHAALLADGLVSLGVTVEPNDRRTNMVFFSVPGDPDRFASSLQGVRFSRMAPNRFRAVLHLDVSRAQVETALEEIRAGLQA